MVEFCWLLLGNMTLMDKSISYSVKASVAVDSNNSFSNSMRLPPGFCRSGHLYTYMASNISLQQWAQC